MRAAQRIARGVHPIQQAIVQPLAHPGQAVVRDEIVQLLRIGLEIVELVGVEKIDSQLPLAIEDAADRGERAEAIVIDLITVELDKHGLAGRAAGIREAPEKA